MEEFRSVKGFEGIYEVSDLGNVRSLDRYVNCKAGSLKKVDGILLKNIKDNNGYLSVNLTDNGKRRKCLVHKLVAIAFLGHEDCGHKVVVDHINNVKTDNRLSNLQLLSPRENVSKEKRGTSKYTGVSWFAQSKKWQASIDLGGKRHYLGLFLTEEEAKDAYDNKLQEYINAN